MGVGELEGNLPFNRSGESWIFRDTSGSRVTGTQTVWWSVFMGDRWKRMSGSCYEKTKMSDMLRNLTFTINR